MRAGYDRVAYTRKAQTITRKSKSGEIIEYPVKTKRIKGTRIPPVPIKDLGLPGKTKGKFPPIKSMALRQYFPSEEMKYEEDACIKAGIKAQKDGKDSYKDLGYKFIQLRRFNVRKNPTLNRNAEMCRQFALIGYDPTKLPTSKTMGKFYTDKSIEKAKAWRK